MAKIDRVDLFPVCYPWSGYWKFLEGSPGHTGVAVKVTADNGVAGWGLSLAVPTWSYETPETLLAVLEHRYGPAILGRDAEDLDATIDALERVLAPAFSLGFPLAMAGLEMALHDLAGRLAGQSLAEGWGRAAGNPVVLSWTIAVRTVDEAEEQIAKAHARGYRNFNIKVGSDPVFDVELARLVRRHAPESFLWADANGGYDLPTALEVAPRLADAGVDVLEAPLRPNRISGYLALRRQKALPITMDEGLISPVEVEEFIRLGMVDGITLKVSRAGGLRSARRQIELACDAGLFWLGSGLTDPDLSLAASLVLYAAYGLERPAALNGPQFLTADILATPLAIETDIAHPPRGPGLGVEVDENKLQALQWAPTRTVARRLAGDA